MNHKIPFEGFTPKQQKLVCWGLFIIHVLDDNSFVSIWSSQGFDVTIKGIFGKPIDGNILEDV
jgi:hypothetical protein